MKINDYLKDRYFTIIIILLTILLINIILIAFNVYKYVIVCIDFITVSSIVICFIYNINKRRKFYNYVFNKLEELDQKYLIVELLKKPTFIEGSLFVDSVYEINKSFIEELNKYRYINNEFKEYIELWCHEIKTPIATSNLIIDNNKNKEMSSIQEEINRIDNYVEQVLYYARSDYLEKDYIIIKTDLKLVVDTVIKRNKKDILTKHIKVNVFNDAIYVNSDNKWLEFIINQIVNNSIKYIANNGIIDITYIENKNSITLDILDNGIGIKEEDLSRVFDKGFTGSNGRINYKSTGMGLYLCKKLCQKLDHNIIINSKNGEYTKVSITFPKSNLTNL